MNKKILKQQIAEARAKVTKLREAKAPAKAPAKKLRETKTLKLSGVGVLVESELDKASLLLSCSAITDRLQDMAEKIAKIEPDELMKMDAAMKAQVGDEVANRFYQKSVEALRALVDGVKAARDAISAEIEGIRTGQVPNDMAMTEPSVAVDAAPPAEDPEALPGDMGMGDEMEPDLSADVDDVDVEEPVMDQEPALGRVRKEPTLAESRNPDKVVLEAFISSMHKTKRATVSARLVAEQFDIDVSDVHEIVRDAAAKKTK